MPTGAGTGSVAQSTVTRWAARWAVGAALGQLVFGGTLRLVLAVMMGAVLGGLGVWLVQRGPGRRGLIQRGLIQRGLIQRGLGRRGRRPASAGGGPATDRTGHVTGDGPATRPSRSAYPRYSPQGPAARR